MKLITQILTFSTRFLCTKSTKMKYLNVAEKNDAAKNISAQLSNGNSRRREGLSVYNKIYEFPATVRGQPTDMVMTSVSGHLLTHEFSSAFRNWQGCDPISLFDAPVRKVCPENFINVKKTLEREIRSCNGLIIWTDCDREGENIGFEIIDVCRAIKPNIIVYRAKFSEITSAAVRRALANLIQPDDKQSAAVDVRSELDLRIGAAFTRFQTLRFQRVLAMNGLISYGSCQIPTLGFVTERYKEHENFIPQAFWKIKMNHKIDLLTVEFLWERHRLFDKQCCEALLMICQANPLVYINTVTLKPKSKYRPIPMDTIQLEKLGSRWLKMTAKQTMTIAEKLYSQGFISYPRTETNIFSKDINLRQLVEIQSPHPDWGAFANRVLDWGTNPRAGKKSDQAHPPIHPTKYPAASFNADEHKVYELIVRHFLACVSQDATGSETIVKVTLAQELFTATGLCIHERNYLDVYIYEKWNSKEIHEYREGDTFMPNELAMDEGTTTAPSMLTEAELIALMDKHGIGTDATHAEHINTIKERGYIGQIERGFLVPGSVGMGLVEGYESVELPLAKPHLRAGLERDLKLICTGQRVPSEVLAEQIEIYRETFRTMTTQADALDRSMANRLHVTIDPTQIPPPPPPPQTMTPICKCQKCGVPDNFMYLKTVNEKLVISCGGYPECRHSIWLPMDSIRLATVSDTSCPRCGAETKRICFTFRRMQQMVLLDSTFMDGLTYTSCLVCDRDLRELLDIDNALTRTTNNTASRTNAQPVRPINNQQNSGNFTTPSVRPPDKRPPPPPLSSSSSSSSSTIDNNNRTNSIPNRPPTDYNNRTNSIPNRPPLNPNSGNLPSTRPSAPPPPPRRRPGAGDNSGGSDDVNCSKCGLPAIKRTVRKEGPNTGREFYNCNNQACNFFQWANTPIPTGGGGGGSGNQNFAGGNGTGRGDNYRRPAAGNHTVPRRNRDDGGDNSDRKRKCGLCRQEGHTRLKCPRRNQYDY